MHKRRFLHGLGLWAATATAALLVPGLSAADDAAWNGVLQAYQLARAKPQTAEVDHALELADAFLAANPRDGRALTYRGSLSTLRARISWMPWKKLAMLNEGVTQMDDGVAMVGKSAKGTAMELEVHLVRGVTSANIPRAFGRGGTAFADFKAVVNHPHFAELSAANRASALAWLSIMYQRQDQPTQAERFMREAEALDPATAARIKAEAA